jgi:diguanylate cyclase
MNNSGDTQIPPFANTGPGLLKPGTPQFDAALKNAKIMMVDDDPLMTALVKKYLARAGYERFVATTDPREAIALMKREKPDLLLLDVLMPNLPGFELLEAVRDDALLGATPIIMLTAESTAESKLRALQLGATDFLSKPVDPSELVLRVRNTLAFLQYQYRVANFDSATSLPGHQLFDANVDAMLARRNSAQELVTLFIVAVPECHQLVETLGQESADILSKVIATRLERFLVSEEVLWASNLIAERLPCIARLDEQRFALAIQAMDDAPAIEASARRLLATLCEPVTVGRHQVWPSAWVGIAAAPADGERGSDLRHGATLAAVHAGLQQQPEARFWFASPELSLQAFEKVTLGSELRGAADRGELELHYQPKVDIDSHRVIGAEALIRWRHPEQGLIPAADFIKLAQEHGLSTQLGEWVFQRACVDAASWAEAGMGHLKVSVNVGKSHLHAPQFCAFVKDTLASSGLQSELLVIEITEGMLNEDLEASYELLTELKTLGLGLAIDNFGSGDSPLTYIKTFPFDVLNIDRRFVADLPGRRADIAVTRTMIELAHRLGMTVTAEGVELPEQLACLKHLECDAFQGYLFAAAMPSGDFIDLLTHDQAEQ